MYGETFHTHAVLTLRKINLNVDLLKRTTGPNNFKLLKLNCTLIVVIL
jgi:hypothetical protein